MPEPLSYNTILLENKYYPKGLTKGEIWEYYQNNKNKILNEVQNRNILLFLAKEKNDLVAKRKYEGGNFIKLNKDNYDKIINGRIISIHSTMNKEERFCIVDIDINSFSKGKIATEKIYDILMNAPFINKLNIKYTGKRGFHIICDLGKKVKVEVSRYLLESYLKRIPDLKNNFTILPKQINKEIPNIDLWSSNKTNGNFITLYSLSIMGIPCVEVSYNELKNFKPKNIHNLEIKMLTF